MKLISTTQSEPWQILDGAFCASGEQSHQLDVNMTQEAQTWEGFGGCFNELGWACLRDLEPMQRRHVLDLLFSRNDGCAFDYCRVPIGANDYAESWYSHNEIEGDFEMNHHCIERDRKSLIPYIRAAQEAAGRSLFLFASPWSPPTWMKHPKVYNHGTLIDAPEYQQAYARYFAKFIESYREEGLRIHAVHVQNEPNSDQKFPSCVWTGEKMRNFIRDYLGPHFEQAGLDTEIWAGTIERAKVNDWANTILWDNECRKYVKGLGYQWAGAGAIQHSTQSWPDIKVVQTENECNSGSNSWQDAMHIHTLLHHYISNGACAYVYWNMILRPGGRSTWGWPQNAMITITQEGEIRINPEYWLMKHFSHFIRPGAKFLTVNGPWASNCVAFRNPNGQLVINAMNPFNHAEPIKVNAGGQIFQANLQALSFNTLLF